MAARVEITAKYARAYRSAGKSEKSRLLDEVVAVTGWSRDNARRRLAAGAKPRAAGPRRRARPRKYSYDALVVLQRVWAFSGGQCGKYLAVSMPGLLDGLERHGELVPGKGRYSAQVRAELVAMSPATIDRYLAPARAKDPLRGKTTTKPSPLLRTSITVRRAGDEVEDTPATPLDRLLTAGVLSPAQEAGLRAYREQLNPADLARRIQSLQDRLTALARDQTLRLQATTERPRPDTARGVRLRTAS